MTIMRAQNDGPSPGGQAVQSGGRKQAEPRPRCGRNHTHANAPPRWLVAFENGGQAYSTLTAEENSTVRRTTPAYASCSCCRCTEKQRRSVPALLASRNAFRPGPEHPPFHYGSGTRTGGMNSLAWAWRRNHAAVVRIHGGTATQLVPFTYPSLPVIN